MNTCVLIPTRSRPTDFLRAYESVVATSKANVFAYVDEDQEEMYRQIIDVPHLIVRYRKPGSSRFEVQGHGTNPRLAILIGKRIGPLAGVNLMAFALTRATPTSVVTEMGQPTAMAYMTDDSTVGPHGWDEWLHGALNDFPHRLGVVSCSYADDDTTVFNFPAMSVEMYHVLGWFGPPQMHAWYWDTALELIADVIGVQYAKRNELRFEHIHMPNEPGKVLTTDDAVAFHYWCLTERKSAITRVRAAVKEFIK